MTDSTDNAGPQFTKFHAIYSSFFSADLYRDVATRWQGLGFSYLFLLVALIITPAMVVLLILIDQTLFGDPYDPQINRIADEIIDQMPALEWRDNQMRIIDNSDETEEIFISMDERILPAIRVDENAAPDSILGTQTFMLLNSQGFHYQKMGGQIGSKSWEEFQLEDGFVLDQTVARTLADDGIQWLTQNRTTLYLTFGFFFWAFTVLAFYLYRIVEALIIGLIGLLMQRILSADLEYHQLVRLAAVGMTPAIILDIFFLAIGLGGISFFMFIIISCAYLGFGIKSLR